MRTKETGGACTREGSNGRITFGMRTTYWHSCVFFLVTVLVIIRIVCMQGSEGAERTEVKAGAIMFQV